MWLIIYYDGRIEKVNSCDDLIGFIDNTVRAIIHIDDA